MKEREKDMLMVEKMVRMYCNHHHDSPDEMCSVCRELTEYAHERLRRCRYGDRKPSCKVCPVHCYKAEMKVRIRHVMRYAGPRMMMYHPMFTLRHSWREIKFLARH